MCKKFFVDIWINLQSYNSYKKLAVVFRVALVEKELHQEPYTREEVCKELDIDVSIEQIIIVNGTIGTVFLLY